MLLGSIFFLTPPLFTQYGVLLCGLIYPAGCSAFLVTDKSSFSLPSQVYNNYDMLIYIYGCKIYIFYYLVFEIINIYI